MRCIFLFENLEYASFKVHIFKKSVSSTVSSMSEVFLYRFLIILLRDSFLTSSISIPTSTFEIARAARLSV